VPITPEKKTQLWSKHPSLQEWLLINDRIPLVYFGNGEEYEIDPDGEFVFVFVFLFV